MLLFQQVHTSKDSQFVLILSPGVTVEFLNLHSDQPLITQYFKLADLSSIQLCLQIQQLCSAAITFLSPNCRKIYIYNLSEANW
jgi:hypothetical protein